MNMAKVSITWKKSSIGRPEKQKRIIRALGLRRLNQTVVKDNSPEIMGMVNKVSHLLEWTVSDS